MRNTDV